MNNSVGSFELALVQAPQDDSETFSSDYQEELIHFAKLTRPTSRRAFTMDSADGGGGLIGEFLFNHAQPILNTVGPALVAYIAGRMGHKVRLKVGDVEIEARNREEVEKLLELANEYQKKLASNAPGS